MQYTSVVDCERMPGGCSRCFSGIPCCKFIVRYVLVSEIPNKSFLSHVRAVSYSYHEDWRIVRGELLDPVVRERSISGDFTH